MKQQGGTLIFDNGRILDTYTNGVIGLGEHGDLFVGYDGSLYVDKECEQDIITPDEMLSKEEAIELSRCMIERWQNKLLKLHLL